MWRSAWNLLRRLLRAPAAAMQSHPNYAGDRDERRLERERFASETRHVGSHADEAPAPPAMPPDPEPTRPTHTGAAP
jgi:hypothetical protein